MPHVCSVSKNSYAINKFHQNKIKLVIFSNSNDSTEKEKNRQKLIQTRSFFI